MTYDTFCEVLHGEILSANEMYANIVAIIAGLDPMAIKASASGAIGTATAAIQGFAIGFFTLFFLIEFARKTFDFGWVKLENVMMFIAKVAGSWGVVSHSDTLMDALYKTFRELFSKVGSGGTAFLNFGGTAPEVAQAIVGKVELGTKNGVLENIGRIATYITYLPTFLILKLTMILVMVMVVGVVFELLIYMFVAPLPLSTFASESVNDVGKGFLKGFIAVALQTFVISVMFRIYGVVIGSDAFKAAMGDNGVGSRA